MSGAQWRRRRREHFGTFSIYFPSISDQIHVIINRIRSKTIILFSNDHSLQIFSRSIGYREHLCTTGGTSTPKSVSTTDDAPSGLDFCCILGTLSATADLARAPKAGGPAASLQSESPTARPRYRKSRHSLARLTRGHHMIRGLVT